MKSFSSFIQQNKTSEDKGYVTNIEQETMDNDSFRKVIYTANDLQLVLMSLDPGQEIGEEVHPSTDQFIRVESGQGVCILGNERFAVADGSAVVIPMGMKHNLINNADAEESMKLYVIYSKPEHD